MDKFCEKYDGYYKYSDGILEKEQYNPLKGFKAECIGIYYKIKIYTNEYLSNGVTISLNSKLIDDRLSRVRASMEYWSRLNLDSRLLEDDRKSKFLSQIPEFLADDFEDRFRVLLNIIMRSDNMVDLILGELRIIPTKSANKFS